MDREHESEGEPDDRSEDGEDTSDLVERSRRGDEAALHLLLLRELDWIRGMVSRNLGGIVRRLDDTSDVVQEAVVRVLRNGPRISIADRAQFRALMSKVVLSTLRSLANRYRAAKRGHDRCADGFDPDHASGGRAGPGRPYTGPDVRAVRDEEGAWIVLARDLLSLEDQDALHMREWEGLAFADIGRRLGVSEDAARMRCVRATRRLGEVVLLLKAGRLDQVLSEDAVTLD
ncbi:MAG: RNA polymerase sigma factor [Planctomycetota bacterium JB042]